MSIHQKVNDRHAQEEIILVSFPGQRSEALPAILRSRLTGEEISSFADLVDDDVKLKISETEVVILDQGAVMVKA